MEKEVDFKSKQDVISLLVITQQIEKSNHLQRPIPNELLTQFNSLISSNLILLMTKEQRQDFFTSYDNIKQSIIDRSTLEKETKKRPRF